MYLLDTNIVSETRKHRPHGAVLEWLRSVAANDIRIAAIAVGEIQTGIELVRTSDPDKAAEFDAWLTRVLATYDVIPMDAITFRIWAKLMVGRQEHLYEDAMIAATAQQHNLTVVTRNKRHLDLFGVPTLNPFPE
jgi:predicted nucleic acid-binding protein